MNLYYNYQYCYFGSYYIRVRYQSNVFFNFREVSHEPGIPGTGIYESGQTGDVCFRLPGRPFVIGSGQEAATTGKVFIARIFEEMFGLGYDFVTCSDLAQTMDQGNLFFKKACGIKRSSRTVLCVAPGGMDKVVLVRCPDDVISAIKQAIEKSWPKGIRSEHSERTYGVLVTKIKLNGNPWISRDAESIDCRRLLISIIENLEKINWRFHAVANIKGGTDSLFFMYDPKRPGNGDLSILSLDKTDRLRLINFGNESSIVKAVAEGIKKSNGRPPEVWNYHGSTEFKVSGTPFYCFGNESIASREMIAGVLQVLRQYGYEVLTGIDVSRKLDDKSSILFRKCHRSSVRHSCISLNDVDTVRIINFPSKASSSLELAVHQHYLPGIRGIMEKDSKTNCCQLKLSGTPWSALDKSYSIHGKSMLMAILREANRLGWDLVASIDVSAKYVHPDSGPGYPVDVHSWFFKYTPDTFGNITML